MTIDLNKLLPLGVMVAIAWHSQGAIKSRLAKFSHIQQNVVAQADISAILRAAQMNAMESGEFRVGNIRDFIRTNIKRAINSADPSLDPWGRPYRGEYLNGRLTIKSAGADTRWGTEDDIEKSENLNRY